MNIFDTPLWEKLEKLLDCAIFEDLADVGDISSRALFNEERSRARIYAKESGIVSGLQIAEACFQKIHRDDSVAVLFNVMDGDYIDKNTIVMEISGYTLDILEAERIALNFLAYFSGIATQTRMFTQALEQSNIKIIDTRKTLPAYREFAKQAVLDGGACNHRMGLYDAVLIKDNHIAAAGSVEHALRKVHAKWKGRFPVILECRNISEVRQALVCPSTFLPQRIILDNMSVSDCEVALKEIVKSEVMPEVELSGNFSLEKVKEYSHLAVNYISVGALTHSVKAFDYTLLVEDL